MYYVPQLPKNKIKYISKKSESTKKILISTPKDKRYEKMKKMLT